MGFAVRGGSELLAGFVNDHGLGELGWRAAASLLLRRRESEE